MTAENQTGSHNNASRYVNSIVMIMTLDDNARECTLQFQNDPRQSKSTPSM